MDQQSDNMKQSIQTLAHRNTDLLEAVIEVVLSRLDDLVESALVLAANEKAKQNKTTLIRDIILGRGTGMHIMSPVTSLETGTHNALRKTSNDSPLIRKWTSLTHGWTLVRARAAQVFILTTRPSLALPLTMQ